MSLLPVAARHSMAACRGRRSLHASPGRGKKWRPIRRPIPDQINSAEAEVTSSENHDQREAADPADHPCLRSQEIARRGRAAHSGSQEHREVYVVTFLVVVLVLPHLLTQQSIRHTVVIVVAFRLDIRHVFLVRVVPDYCSCSNSNADKDSDYDLVHSMFLMVAVELLGTRSTVAGMPGWGRL